MSTATVSTTALRTRARIAAHSLWDALVDPAVSGAADVPWRPEAITADWITAIVGSGTPGAVAERVEISGGDEGSSVRRRVRVEWNAAGRAAGLPQALFAKSTPTMTTRLSAGMVAPAEGRFLREIRPSLAIEAPICLHSARDPRSGRSLHLLEDLVAGKGARFCNVRTTIDHAHAEQIVDLLAELHGTFLGKRPVSDCDWLGTFEDFFRAAERTGIRPAHEEAMERAAAVIPARLLQRREGIWRAAETALNAHAAAPRTVIHSDVHLGNWYITGDNRMGICDWARVCRGLWARDLAYALMTNLAVEDRRAWERELVARYRDRLRTGFGCEIGADAAWLAYRQQSFAALLMWTPTLCPPGLLPDMQPEDMTLEMIHRIATAMDDIDALDSLG